jgi:hypothetical protein
MTAVSNNPKNIEAVKNEIIATTVTGPQIEEISSISFVTYFIIKSNEKQLITVNAIFPMKMNTVARNLENANFIICLIFKRKASHAPMQKLPPATAI